VALVSGWCWKHDRTGPGAAIARLRRRGGGNRERHEGSLSMNVLPPTTVASSADSWGGLIGLTWMTGYWATLIPMWVYFIVGVLCAH